MLTPSRAKKEVDSDLEKKAIFADFKRLQDWLIKLCNHVPPNKHVRCGPCMHASGLMYALPGVWQLRCRRYAWLNHCAAVGRSSPKSLWVQLDFACTQVVLAARDGVLGHGPDVPAARAGAGQGAAGPATARQRPSGAGVLTFVTTPTPLLGSIP